MGKTTMKTFLEENSHLRIAIQHMDIHNGCFCIMVFNTTWCPSEPIFKHCITDFDIQHSLVDFETMIMTPVIIWWEEKKSRKEN